MGMVIKVYWQACRVLYTKKKKKKTISVCNSGEFWSWDKEEKDNKRIKSWRTLMLKERRRADREWKISQDIKRAKGILRLCFRRIRKTGCQGVMMKQPVLKG